MSGKRLLLPLKKVCKMKYFANLYSISFPTSFKRTEIMSVSREYIPVLSSTVTGRSLGLHVVLDHAGHHGHHLLLVQVHDGDAGVVHVAFALHLPVLTGETITCKSFLSLRGYSCESRVN